MLLEEADIDNPRRSSMPAVLRACEHLVYMKVIIWLLWLRFNLLVMGDTVDSTQEHDIWYDYGGKCIFTMHN